MPANHAKFNELPAELHVMVFKELIASYESLSAPAKPFPESTGSKIFREEVLPLCTLNSTWRMLVQGMLYETTEVRGENLLGFIGLAMANPALILCVKSLEVTHVAGCSLDDEASRERTAARKEKLQEDKKVYTPSPARDLVLKSRPLTRADREASFTETWSNLRDLFAVAEMHGQAKLERLKITGNDMHLGRFNHRAMPQYLFIPQRFQQQQGRELEPLPGVKLKHLTLEPEILDNLELNPELVRAIINQHADITSLELKVSDIRAYRLFRKAIYEGTVSTIVGLNASHANLTSFTLEYPSSTQMYRENDPPNRIFSCADVENEVDALCNALRVLSQRLVMFRFSGRICKGLFDGDGDSGWPKLEEYTVVFDHADAFGQWLVPPHHWHNFFDYCGADECEDCAFGDATFVYEASAGEDPALSGLVLAEEGPGGDYGFEEGFDLLLCEMCKVRPLITEIEPDEGRINEVFVAASGAMLRMPRMRKWKFRSVDKAVTFSFKFEGPEIYSAVIRRWWDPKPEAMAIWRSRFPDLDLNISKKDDQYFEDD